MNANHENHQVTTETFCTPGTQEAQSRTMGLHCFSTEAIYAISDCLSSSHPDVDSQLDSDSRFQSADFDVCVDMAAEVCSGMEYLHNNDIIHKDLGTRSCLIDSDGVVKIAYLGPGLLSILQQASAISVLPTSLVFLTHLFHPSPLEDPIQLEQPFILTSRALHSSSFAILSSDIKGQKIHQDL